MSFLCISARITPSLTSALGGKIASARFNVVAMKQVFQDVANGRSLVIEVPLPQCRSGHLTIKSTHSLISAGTERMLVEFGRAGYIDKARQQPEKVRAVLQKVGTDGIMTTVEAVRAKLDQPLPMGYANVGVVAEVGEDVTGFSVGDRVVSNGSHAEFVSVPKNLCARIPDDVPDIDAVFSIVGAIALQGVRLIKPTIGECFVVTGLGLIGLLTVQILRANGCRVLGIDLDAEKTKLARKYGAETIELANGEDPISAAEIFSRGRGVDGVIITASTKSNEPIRQAATMCRKRGRIVLVGVTGLEINRSDFYEKELRFQVSCSYGPGRYDPIYEEKGHDYPIGFVRWTEQRNIESILDLLSSGALRIDELRSDSFEIDDVPNAYDRLMTDKSVLGLLINYPHDSSAHRGPGARTIPTASASTASDVIIGAIGAGNYAGRILLPAIKNTGARLKTIVSSKGISAALCGRKLGFETASTDLDALLGDTEINTVIVATQHDSHARMVIDAINAGKNVFVEKPLALNSDEIAEIDSAYRTANEAGNYVRLMVGFNRRFSPYAKRVKSEIGKSKAPISIIYTCNAGFIPHDSWVQDPIRGGGRIVGEACHFIDLSRFLSDSPIESISACGLISAQPETDCRDTASINITFENGSLATVHYFANGHPSFPKERIEVFQGGKVLVLDNFRSLRQYGQNRFRLRSFRQDKGHAECCEQFVNAIRSGRPTPIPFEELIEVARASIRVSAALELD